MTLRHRNQKVCGKFRHDVNLVVARYFCRFKLMAVRNISQIFTILSYSSDLSSAGLSDLQRVLCIILRCIWSELCSATSFRNGAASHCPFGFRVAGSNFLLIFTSLNRSLWSTLRKDACNGVILFPILIVTLCVIFLRPS